MKNLASCLVLAAVASAQSAPYPAGVDYDPAIPTIESVVGHDYGQRISSHAETERYLAALADASPRVALVEYGRSWEGRALYYLAIGSADNIARLDELSVGMQTLADPRGVAQSKLDGLTDSLPAPVWLAYSVHGNEISGTDAALQTAYHLVAARDDAVADAAREQCLVLIDPLQNPDGRDRFVHYYRETRGRWPDADARAAEHNEAWPGGRTNHYLFDMNRDWIVLSQIETRARVAAFLDWYPLVYVDLHEMGANSTYYFPPPAEPINPQFTRTQVEWLERFGRNNAAWFDRFGIDYFTREVFDAFYPGYGEGWPAFHGAIGMTYEQASVRGLVVERDDGTKLTYGESVRHHFLASLATIETAARHRGQMLRDFVEYRRADLGNEIGVEGAPATTDYLLPPGRDPNRTRELVALLMAQGIEVSESTTEAVVSVRGLEDEPQDVTMPVGTFRVSVAQPAARLAINLLARDQKVDPEFVAEQERRRKKRLSVQFYDVTSWSLPLLFDVECWSASGAPAGDHRVLTEAPRPVGRAPGREATVAYLIPWGSHASARALAAVLREELRAHGAGKRFVLGGREYPAGTVVVKVKGNPEGVHERMQAIAEETGATVVPTDTAWVDEGIGLGSNEMRYLEPPRVALAYGRPTSAYSVGWSRYLLEQDFGYPVTILHVHDLGRADLSDYDVLVLPGSRGLGGALGGTAEDIVRWVRAGGTLITLGETTRWLTEESVGLLATASEDRERPDGEGRDEDGDEDSGDAEESEPFDYEEAIQPETEAPERTPGAIVRVVIDEDHWLGFGYGERTNVLVGSRNIFTPIKLDKGTNVAVYESSDRLVLSGQTWYDAVEQLGNKAYLVHQPHGEGHVVAFAEDPNYRAICDGLNLMFLNAVFFGPAY